MGAGDGEHALLLGSGVQRPIVRIGVAWVPEVDPPIIAPRPRRLLAGEVFQPPAPPRLKRGGGRAILEEDFGGGACACFLDPRQAMRTLRRAGRVGNEKRGGAAGKQA